jgi:hypothetical protein
MVQHEAAEYDIERGIGEGHLLGRLDLECEDGFVVISVACLGAGYFDHFGRGVYTSDETVRARAARSQECQLAGAAADIEYVFAVAKVGEVEG